MAKENGGRQFQLRQLVAQQAARMMAEDGVSDYGYAKLKKKLSFSMRFLIATIKRKLCERFVRMRSLPCKYSLDLTRT